MKVTVQFEAGKDPAEFDSDCAAAVRTLLALVAAAKEEGPANVLGTIRPITSDGKRIGRIHVGPGVR